MGYYIEYTDEGKYEWCVYSSAYGIAMGETDTLDEAIAELMIGEATVMEEPYDKTSVQRLREDPARWTKDLPRPDVDDGRWKPMKPYTGPGSPQWTAREFLELQREAHE